MGNWVHVHSSIIFDNQLARKKFTLGKLKIPSDSFNETKLNTAFTEQPNERAGAILSIYGTLSGITSDRDTLAYIREVVSINLDNGFDIYRFYLETEYDTVIGTEVRVYTYDYELDIIVKQ